MKTLKILGLSVVGFSALAALPAMAQSTQGYVTDTRGAIVKETFGLCVRTGYWSPAMAIAECDPDLVPRPAAPPPPAPRAVPAPPPPKPAAAAPAAPKRCDAVVKFSADEAFEFNKAQIKPAAQSRLDRDVVAKIADCSRLDLVLVSGHTDRLGSQQYNQKLSEKRADAVKAYLIKKGVDGGKIDTIGMGKTLQIKSCADGKNRKALIECLAPNRRVEVEIKGLAK
jgi:OmpA-OmpF porin, OOP family